MEILIIDVLMFEIIIRLRVMAMGWLLCSWNGCTQWMRAGSTNLSVDNHLVIFF